MAESHEHKATVAGTILITGGTSGIGLATALELARRGAGVILVGRDPARGASAVAAIKSAAPGAEARFWRYDLALMREVQRLADDLARLAPHLDAVVHAAGVMLPRRTLTVEGLETVFAVQYFARFLLTTRLIDHYGDALRVVSISAGGTIPLRLDVRNLNGERFYQGIYTLLHESVANDLFTLKLLRLHPDLACYNYGPFLVSTHLFDLMPPWFRGITHALAPLLATTPTAAANDITRLLVDRFPSGFYRRGLKSLTPSRYRRDSKIQDHLWDTSADIIRTASAAMVSAGS